MCRAFITSEKAIIVRHIVSSNLVKENRLFYVENGLYDLKRNNKSFFGMITVTYSL